MIDDDSDFLTAVTPFLKSHGYEVAVTISSEEGFLLLQSFLPNLILLNVDIGTKDGRELSKKIKGSVEFHHIPVVLLSSSPDSLKLYRNFGADAIIDKPFKLPIFLDVLHRFF